MRKEVYLEAMPTIKQKRVVAKILQNGGKSIGAAMREVGYSHAMSVNPQLLTRSEGFKQACDDLGLTDDFLVKALVSDIKAKPKRRIRELELAFRVKGRYEGGEPETSPGLKGATFVQVNIFPPNGTKNSRHSSDRKAVPSVGSTS